MQSKLRPLFTLLFLCAIFSLNVSKVYAGFGVSPAKIVEDNLIRGSILERTLYFVQGMPDRDLDVKIEVDDSPIKSWIKIEPSGNFVIPKGVQQFPVTVTVTVPKDAELGIYTGFVRAVGALMLDPLRKEGESHVSIAIGARAELSLTVGKGILYRYAIRDIDLKNILQTQNPIADVNIENQGNVPAGPSEASFELFNKFGDVRLAYVQGVKMELVKPFAVQSVAVEFPITLATLSVGEYWGTVKLYNDKGEVVREFKDVFNVKEATFLDIYGRYILIIISIIIVLIILRFVLKRR